MTSIELDDILTRLKLQCSSTVHLHIAPVKSWRQTVFLRICVLRTAQTSASWLSLMGNHAGTLFNTLFTRQAFTLH